MDEVQRSDPLAESVSLLSLTDTENLDTNVSHRLEVSKRVGDACDGLVRHYQSAPENLSNWITRAPHTTSSTLDILKSYPDTVPMNHDLDWDVQTWYRDEAKTICALESQMETLSAIFDSLSCVSRHDLCPLGSVSSIIWGSFEMLLLEAAAEGNYAFSLHQRGLFVKSDLLKVFCQIFQAFDFPFTINWIPNCTFVSIYAAHAMSDIYKKLAGFLGRLVKVQLRALAAANEQELQQLDEEIQTYPQWISNEITDFQRAGEEFRKAASTEQTWRDSAISAALEESKKLANDHNLPAACQLLEFKVEDLGAIPDPPPSVDRRQLEVQVRTELLQLYKQAKDHANMASQASRLHTLLRQILGRHSCFAAMSSNSYAISLASLNTASTTARDILIEALDSMETLYGLESQLVGMQCGLLGRINIALGDADKALPMLQRGMSILEAWLCEDNLLMFDRIVGDTRNLLAKQGKRAEAITLSQRIAKSSEAKLGLQHIQTCKYLVDVGYENLQLGKDAAAETSLLIALERLKKTVGEEHSEALRAMSNLASVYGQQSRFEESIRLNRRVLEIREKTTGLTSWATLRSMSNLGVALRQFGATDEAKSVLIETRRRLEEAGVAAACEDIIHTAEGALHGLEEAVDPENALTRAEERVSGIDMSEGIVVRAYEAESIAILIEMYSASGRLDDAYRLAKRAGELRYACEGEEAMKWDFHEHLAQILQKMTDREEEFVQVCREAFVKCGVETPSGSVTNTLVRRELMLATALLEAKQDGEGVRTMRSGMQRSTQLEDGRSYYRLGFSNLFRYYTGKALSGDNINLSSKRLDFWETLIGLLEPEADGERGPHVF